MTNDVNEATIVCTLCGQPRQADQVRWFLPDAADGQTLIMNWPETAPNDPAGVPYCAGCLAEQIADESENVIG
jgi:hypothetical protein